MKNKVVGFSMIELMVVIAIVCILLAVGLPAYTPIINGIRMDGELNELMGGLNFARSEAIKRGLTVSVCPGATACGSGNDWSNGWMVSLNGPPAQTLQLAPAYSHGETLSSTSSASPPYPQFTSMGYTFFTGTLSLHDSGNTPSLYRCISFNAGSWTRLSGASCP